VALMSQAVAVDGRYSKYTLMIMTYESRLRLAQLAVRHYSRCPSVGEVVVVWNAGRVRRSKVQGRLKTMDEEVSQRPAWCHKTRV